MKELLRNDISYWYASVMAMFVKMHLQLLINKVLGGVDTSSSENAQNKNGAPSWS